MSLIRAVCRTPDDACGSIHIGGLTPADGDRSTRCAVNPADFNVSPGDQGCLFNTIRVNSVCEVPDGG